MRKIADLINQNSPTTSFEFFPPKDAGSTARFAVALEELARTRPDFVSVTYGAAGSGRDRTRDVVLATQAAHDFPVMAHLTCVGHTKAEIMSLVDEYVANGVDNILALGGDVPATGYVPHGEFAHAVDLVDFLRNNYDLSIGVAAHPEGHPRSADLVSDRQRLAEKLEAADFAVTQFFFDADHYISMVDDLAGYGCVKPVIAGVIPITNPAQVKRFADMAGATIPVELVQRIEAAADASEVAKIGVDAAVELGQDLLDAGAPGLHLYSLNRSTPSVQVLDELGLGSSSLCS